MIGCYDILVNFSEALGIRYFLFSYLCSTYMFYSMYRDAKETMSMWLHKYAYSEHCKTPVPRRMFL